MIQLKKFFPATLFLIAMMTYTSCGIDEIISQLSEADVVEIIESTLQSNTGGLSTNIEDLTEQLVTAVTSGELCDTLYSKTAEDSFQGIQVQTSYNTGMTYEMGCNTLGVPEDATFSCFTEAMYSTPRIVSNDGGSFTGSVLGLQPATAALVLEGSYSKTGSQDLDFAEAHSISSVFAVDLTNLAINKSTLNIESGTGTFTFTGTTEDAAFSYAGEIVFNGNGTATLTMNGNTYELNFN